MSFPSNIHAAYDGSPPVHPSSTGLALSGLDDGAYAALFSDDGVQTTCAAGDKCKADAAMDIRGSTHSCMCCSIGIHCWMMCGSLFDEWLPTVNSVGFHPSMLAPYGQGKFRDYSDRLGETCLYICHCCMDTVAMKISLGAGAVADAGASVGLDVRDNVTSSTASTLSPPTNTEPEVPLAPPPGHDPDVRATYFTNGIQTKCADDNEDWVLDLDGRGNVDYEGNVVFESEEDAANNHLIEETFTNPVTDPQIVIQRIMEFSKCLFTQLEQGCGLTIQQCMNPLENTTSSENMHNTIRFGTKRTSRYFADIVFTMSYISRLLSENITETLRSVYYALKPRIHCQRYSDGLILKIGNILRVSRRSLGIVASSKGLMGGCIVITRKKTLPSGEERVESIDGSGIFETNRMQITHEWLERDENGTTRSGDKVTATTTAKVILIIEKEGIFQHLMAAKFFEQFPSILVTGKGYPDFATKAFVCSIHRELHLPVVGLCDYNPYGIHVLGTYYFSNLSGVDGESRFSVPIQWLGIRPSHINLIKEFVQVFAFQQLTDRDLNLIASLMQGKGYLNDEDRDAILVMKNQGFKLELEALHQLRFDLLGSFVLHMLEENYVQTASGV